MKEPRNVENRITTAVTHAAMADNLCAQSANDDPAQLGEWRRNVDMVGVLVPMRWSGPRDDEEWNR
jgi:hypothetical protein